MFLLLYRRFIFVIDCQKVPETGSIFTYIIETTSHRLDVESM